MRHAACEPEVFYLTILNEGGVYYMDWQWSRMAAKDFIESRLRKTDSLLQNSQKNRKLSEKK